MCSRSRAAPAGKLSGRRIRRELSRPGAARHGCAAGYLVVRPEFLRFLDRPDDADNHVDGRLYNEYALGSRIQYQVRVGDQVFVVEKLAPAGLCRPASTRRC